MHEMSRDEWRAFLLEGTRTAKLATTREYGGRNDVDGELPVRVTPAEVLGPTGIAD